MTSGLTEILMPPQNHEREKQQWPGSSRSCPGQELRSKVKCANALQEGTKRTEMENLNQVTHTEKASLVSLEERTAPD